MSRNRGSAQQALEEIVRRAAEVAALERIIRFGSAARGIPGPRSGVDLLVIKRGAIRPLDVMAETSRNFSGAPHPLDCRRDARGRATLQEQSRPGHRTSPAGGQSRLWRSGALMQTTRKNGGTGPGASLAPSPNLPAFILRTSAFMPGKGRRKPSRERISCPD
jgi:hypothetical protein